MLQRTCAGKPGLSTESEEVCSEISASRERHSECRAVCKKSREMVENGLKMAKNGYKWLKMTKNG